MDAKLKALVQQLNRVILDKEHQIKLAVSCMLARGHLLIEDLPGMGKTTLSHALANVMGLKYQRIQFTSDLLPADILGGSVFEQRPTGGAFVFHKGPIFSQVVLADEINRATPKTQSALLEAMEEHQVSVDGETYSLPDPFFVIATQNPVTQSGTFNLPESQLDRFLMRVQLGYPSREAERALLKGDQWFTDQLKVIISPEEFQSYQAKVKSIVASEPLLDYIQNLVNATRERSDVIAGLSPRGALSLLNGAKAWVMLHGRNHVLPDDVQQVFPAVVEHRLAAGNIADEILSSVPVV